MNINEVPYPDLKSYRGLKQEHIDWLLKAGVTVEAMIWPQAMRLAVGVKAHDGKFDEETARDLWVMFPEREDVVFWQPRTGELATWNGRAFALGQDAINNPGTYSFDCALNIFESPLEWLKCGRDGIVIVDWAAAYERLQDCPRVAVEESLLFQYRRHMKPPRGPEVFVLTGRRAAA